MDRLLVAALAGLGCPVGVLFFYALVRPKMVLAFFGRGRGEPLDSAVVGLRVALGAWLFAMAFAAGLFTAFLAQTSRS